MTTKDPATDVLDDEVFLDTMEALYASERSPKIDDERKKRILENTLHSQKPEEKRFDINRWLLLAAGLCLGLPFITSYMFSSQPETIWKGYEGSESSHRLTMTWSETNREVSFYTKEDGFVLLYLKKTDGSFEALELLETKSGHHQIPLSIPENSESLCAEFDKNQELLQVLSERISLLEKEATCVQLQLEQL
ncbi:hypothetical protein [Pseudobacteriovorax antillogorgiicola]|uniref:Uncharacterized protein n=1 Tax=Pseudobacteriovorax antillogorgiicola TaxID=1513793 RepID=A0A1Y6BQT3_9BACT|nr:hypothetical protein [Pseudobacteriovorax antillogorgiicola]TCS54712.1 hypothetical protein EDD56_106225 [Pseudobacteriovorax antillogorgiicola]SMF16126.1 hypothetical protein SAMN06296036_10618 [Pseudobacteriovorax antillogorgiicola]